MDALILHKWSLGSSTRYNKLSITVKVRIFRQKQSFILLKGDGYTWSRCTNAGDGAPFSSGNKLRFPLDGRKGLTEIELAFNDETTDGAITELEFENASKKCELKPIYSHIHKMIHVL